MTTWTGSNGNRVRRIEPLGYNSVAQTYQIAGVIGDTGGTLTCGNLSGIDNVSVWIEFSHGSNKIYTATGNGAVGGTTIVNTAHTEANDYWNQHVALMVTGTCAGESQTITDFDAATDTLTTDAFTAQIDSGDTYKIISKGYSTALLYYISGNTVVVAYTNPAGAHTVHVKVWGKR